MPGRATTSRSQMPDTSVSLDGIRLQAQPLPPDLSISFLSWQGSIYEKLGPWRLLTPTSPKHRRRRAVEPSGRIVHETREHAAPRERHDRKTKHADKHGLPQRSETRVTGDHDERVGTGRRVDGPGEKHVPERERLRERVDPKRFAEALIAGDADERAAKVAAEERSRLRSWSAGEPKQENR